MSRVYLLYHFFHPDDVISARLFSDLAVACKDAGHDVVACPSTRSCHASSGQYERFESWGGGLIRRIWRPNFRQSSTAGRLLNSLFMLIGWAWIAATFRPFKGPGSREIMIIGTDPIFGVLATIPWRLFRRNATIIHWCHDVHPEATLAEGKLSESSLLVLVLKRLLKIAYHRCDVVVDLGACMRRLILSAGGWDNPSAKIPGLATITPWSLIEPDGVTTVDPEVRRQLFGECRLAFLYSGNLGRAHDVERFLQFARATRHDGFQFCFAGRGQGFDLLKASLSDDDSNISFAGFSDEAELQKRLSACDIHLVSLRESWTGTVVPSKFFGAISTGRPVLFSGSELSCIAGWINEHGLGWNLTSANLDQVREKLIDYSQSTKVRDETRVRCWSVYQQYFSKRTQLQKWLSLASSPTEFNES